MRSRYSLVRLSPSSTSSAHLPRGSAGVEAAALSERLPSGSCLFACVRYHSLAYLRLHPEHTVSRPLPTW